MHGSGRQQKATCNNLFSPSLTLHLAPPQRTDSPCPMKLSLSLQLVPWSWLGFGGNAWRTRRPSNCQQVMKLVMVTACTYFWPLLKDRVQKKSIQVKEVDWGHHRCKVLVGLMLVQNRTRWFALVELSSGREGTSDGNDGVCVMNFYSRLWRMWG